MHRSHSRVLLVPHKHLHCHKYLPLYSKTHANQQAEIRSNLVRQNKGIPVQVILGNLLQVYPVGKHVPVREDVYRVK